MVKRAVLCLLFLVMAAAIAFAQTSIKAEVDKISLTTDEVLTYKVTVVSSERNVPLPELPKFDGFKILSQAQSRSFNLSAGSARNSFVFILLLAPLKTGELKIPPCTIKLDGKNYSTDTFKIEIKQGKFKPEPKESLPQGSSSDSEQTTL